MIDREPRELDAAQHKFLDALSQQVIRLFELRKTVKALEELENVLEKKSKKLEDYDTIIAHDIKAHFRNIEVSSELLHKINEDKLDSKSVEHLDNIKSESRKAIHFINEIGNHELSARA